MKAKQTILDLWQRADALGIVATFVNVYGEKVAADRYKETVDAFSREDDVRIVKSIHNLVKDMPATGFQHWPALLTIFELQSHTLDDDYDAREGVTSYTRDPNINMLSEKVTEDNALDDVEPCDDAYNYAQLKDTLDDDR